MKIEKTQIKTNIKGKIKITEMFTLTPEDGLLIRNKITGQIINTFIVVSPESEIANYEDFED